MPTAAPSFARPGAKRTLYLASTLTVVAAAIAAPALPAMRDHFAGMRHVDLLTRLVLVTPPLFIVLFSPLAGWLADRVGRRALLLASTALYALAGSSGAWLPALYEILGGRAILGLAVAGTMTAATTLLADLGGDDAGAEDLRHRVLGRQSAAIGVTGALFLAVGGVLAETAWRVPFLLYLLALPLLVPMLRTLREPPHPRSERRGERLPAGRIAPLWALVFVAQLVFYLAPVHLPFHLRELGTPGSAAAGLALGLLTLSYAGGALVAARAAAALDRHLLFAFAFALAGASYVWIGLQAHWLAVLPGLAVAGFGLGLLVPNVFAFAADAAPANARGRAMGSVTAFLFLGQFAAPIVSAPVTSAWGYGAAFGLAGGAALAVAAASALLRPASVRAARRT